MKPIIFWRQLETKNANELVFLKGGEKPALFMGWLLLAVCIFYACILVLWISLARGGIVGILQSKDAVDAILVYFFLGIQLFVFFEGLLISVWLIFGRTTLVIDRTAKTITKSYRMRSFPIFQRVYAARNTSSLSVHRAGGLWRVLFVPSIYLNDEAGGRQILLLLPWKRQKEGIAMAEQIAAFLSIPGP